LKSPNPSACVLNLDVLLKGGRLEWSPQRDTPSEVLSEEPAGFSVFSGQAQVTKVRDESRRLPRR